jgi:hypothetical protein
MKRTLAMLLASVLVSSVAAADPLPLPPVHVTPVSPVPSTVPPLRGPTPTLMCPNPAATSIDFSIASRATRFAGRVHIVGTVKNLGNAPYVSGANQQLALLYEVSPGAPGGRLVATRRFQNLAPGEAVTVAFDREWSSSMEFPPNYRLIISYDPDISIDGNPKNDDCVTSDNSRERPGGEISALFH